MLFHTQHNYIELEPTSHQKYLAYEAISGIQWLLILVKGQLTEGLWYHHLEGQTESCVMSWLIHWCQILENLREHQDITMFPRPEIRNQITQVRLMRPSSCYHRFLSCLGIMGMSLFCLSNWAHFSEKQKTTFGSCNLLRLWKGPLFLIFASFLFFIR